MASLVLFTSFFLVICMHSSNARLLLTVVKHRSSTRSHHLQIAEKINGGDEMVERTRAPVIRPPATPFSKAEFGESLTGNEQNDAGSDIVESSSFHHVALLKGKHVEDSKKPIVSRYPGKEEVKHSENDDIVVTDYQPPHRKAPIHNK
ncbi:uncharacterized protein LOC111910841 [Lactuca sativa]|uniref:uncharacterized protein LOC111910841 n=1 Tax=Lactuca sativa TaxID=4236 RepID=UPI000CB1B46F|nr:uncharacterized protein LOC111910841 [Lactuca sativa]